MNAKPVTSRPSPIAIRTNSAERSAMCAPERSHRLSSTRPIPGTGKPIREPSSSTPSAAAHSGSCAGNGSSAPTIQSTPPAAVQMSTSVKSRATSRSSRRAASTMNAVRPTCMTTYAIAKIQARSPKESAIDTLITSPTNASATTAMRTGRRTGSSQLVTHVVATHVHHSAVTMIAPSSAPSGVSCSTR